jgi:hypothetical protein
MGRERVIRRRRSLLEWPFSSRTSRASRLLWLWPLIFVGTAYGAAELALHRKKGDGGGYGIESVGARVRGKQLVGAIPSITRSTWKSIAHGCGVSMVSGKTLVMRSALLSIGTTLAASFSSAAHVRDQHPAHRC